MVDFIIRKCLAAVGDTFGCRARDLAELITCRGEAGMIVSDNGFELTSILMPALSAKLGVERHDIAPGKPIKTDGARSGSLVSFAFNGRLRDELFNETSVLKLANFRVEVDLRLGLQPAQTAFHPWPRNPGCVRLRPGQAMARFAK